MYIFKPNDVLIPQHCEPFFILWQICSSAGMFIESSTPNATPLSLLHLCGPSDASRNVDEQTNTEHINQRHKSTTLRRSKIRPLRKSGTQILWFSSSNILHQLPYNEQSRQQGCWRQMQVLSNNACTYGPSRFHDSLYNSPWFCWLADCPSPLSS